MGRRSEYRRQNHFVSRTGEHVIRGTAEQIAHRYEQLAADARAMKDDVSAQRFMQPADHYKRIMNNANAE